MSLLRSLWVYRSEILLAIELLRRLRKTAAEAAQEYIRKKLRTKLTLSIAIVSAQVVLLLTALWVMAEVPRLSSRIFGSVVLWLVTLYNGFELLFFTLPELHALHRTLKSKVGYTARVFLRVSLVTEALRLNVVFLAVCLALGVSTRTAISTRFAYLEPWKQLARTAAPRVRPPRRR